LYIGKNQVLPGAPVYIIAEISANHNQSLQRAIEIVHAASEAGANAVKLQTYTADTITLDSDKDYFRVKGTIWNGMTLHKLYSEAFTPWEWHSEIRAESKKLGMDFFSSPFDSTAVEFLESIDTDAYKIASSEIVDIPLLEKVGATGRPVILSTGMATMAEIDEAVSTLRGAGAVDIVLLKCTAAYPAPPEEMNLKTIPNMAEAFQVPVGLSDHSMGHEVAIAAVALGAVAVEKHLTLKRSDGGPDSAFSMEPVEFGEMVRAIRLVENAMGKVSYAPSESEVIPRKYRRSLFIAEDVKAGEMFTERNVRSVRPGDGLHTRYLGKVIGKKASRDLEKGTPLAWEDITWQRV